MFVFNHHQLTHLYFSISFPNWAWRRFRATLCKHTLCFIAPFLFFCTYCPFTTVSSLLANGFPTCNLLLILFRIQSSSSRHCVQIMTRPPFSPGPPRGRRYNSDTGRPALNWDSARTYLDSLPLPPVYQRLNERTVPVLIRSTPGDDLLSISAWVRDITDAWVLVQYSPRIERHSGVSYLRVMEVDDLASWASTRYPSRSRIPLPSRFLDHPPSPSHLDPRSPTRGRSPPLRTGRHSPLEHRHHSYLSENLRETGSQVRQRREPIGHTTYLNRTNRRTNLIRSDDSAPLQSSFRRDSDPPPPYPSEFPSSSSSTAVLDANYIDF